MAAQFLANQGFDLDAIVNSVQFGHSSVNKPTAIRANQSSQQVSTILNASLPNTPQGSLWDVTLRDREVASTTSHDPSKLEDSLPLNTLDAYTALFAPSLCHPHIHLDKPYLLSHPAHSHLQIKKGDFAEAMELTNAAKKNFKRDDLIERGQRLIDESVQAGVTSMRAFVEVDPIVGLTCLDAGKELQARAKDKCEVQLCAFAQLALFTNHDDDGEEMRRLFTTAVSRSEVAVVGSTPYVETTTEAQRRNIEYTIDLALAQDKHLDFHLDYNLDPNIEPLVWFVIETLVSRQWTSKTKKKIVLGHCTRLTLFSDGEWQKLASKITDSGLPISFVGLPTSDLFMMRTENGTRGTLPIPRMVKEWGLNAAIGVNNVGNAFTPQGCCDPMSIASLGVGVYQAGTVKNAETLYECVSTRARAAIGLSDSNDVTGLALAQGKRADLVLFGKEEVAWRTRRTVSEAVYLYDGGKGRRVLKDAVLVG